MKAEQNNFVDIRYAQNGASSATNELGMREMQAKAYEHRTERFCEFMNNSCPAKISIP